MKKNVLLLFFVIAFASCELKPNQYPLRFDEFDALKNEIAQKGIPYTHGKIFDRGIRLTDSNDIFELKSDSSKIYKKKSRKRRRDYLLPISKLIGITGFYTGCL